MNNFMTGEVRTLGQAINEYIYCDENENENDRELKAYKQAEYEISCKPELKEALAIIDKYKKNIQNT